MDRHDQSPGVAALDSLAHMRASLQGVVWTGRGVHHILGCMATHVHRGSLGWTRSV